MSVKVEWLCSRCADKESKETETDPVLLRLCTSCKVENYVRPFGHAGEDAFASEEEKAAAQIKASEEAKVMRAARDKYVEEHPNEVTEGIEEAKAEIEAGTGINTTAPIEEPELGIAGSHPEEAQIPPEEMTPIPEPPLEVTVEPELEPSKPLDKMTKAELLKELESRG